MLGRFDRALASLLDFSLLQIDDGGIYLKCHRLVRVAVSESMSPKTKSSVFNRVIFQLNAAFPLQSDGRPLHDQWAECEKLAPQVAGVLDSYSIYKDDLDEPILLCEIVARCSWYVAQVRHGKLCTNPEYLTVFGRERYFYEKGQFETALQLIEKALLICHSALKTSDHPGYSPWFVKDMTSHLINVQATIDREKPAADYGLHLSEEVCAIRESNQRPGNQEDIFWIATARGNLAVSLMGIGQFQQALDILFDLISRSDMKPHEDIYLCNICLGLTHVGRLDEALAYNGRAVRAIEAFKGHDTVQMAL